MRWTDSVKSHSTSLQDGALWAASFRGLLGVGAHSAGQVLHRKSSPVPPVLREPEPTCRCDYLVRPPEGRARREVKRSELLVITNKISWG